jgi:hypothetical protein
MNNSIRKHTITALIENQPGVLARVVGLISPAMTASSNKSVSNLPNSWT